MTPTFSAPAPLVRAAPQDRLTGDPAAWYEADTMGRFSGIGLNFANPFRSSPAPGAKMYIREGVWLRSVVGKFGDVIVYGPPKYSPIPPKGWKAARGRLRQQKVIKTVATKVADAIMAAFDKAHPGWDRRKKAYKDLKRSVHDRVLEKWMEARGLGHESLSNEWKNLEYKDPPITQPKRGPGKKGTAHTKKESYPPSTDPAKPWWTSPPTYRAECHAQRIADVTYQGFTDEIRLKWRRACTKAYRTSYDVYQHVAIPRLVRGIPVSPEPPEQAGWKIRRLEQDRDYWHDQTPKKHWAYPDASCQTWGLAMGHVAFAIHHWWDGFEWRENPATLWSLYADVGLGHERDKGFITCTIYAGYQFSGESKTFERIWWPEMEANPISHDIKAHSASFLWEPAKRDYEGYLIAPRTPDTAKGITVKAATTDWAWYHFRLPYPSKKCTRINMSEYIKEWPQAELDFYVEYH